MACKSSGMSRFDTMNLHGLAFNTSRHLLAE